MTLSETHTNHPLSIQFLYGVGFGITMASALPSPSGQGSVLTDMVNKICTNKKSPSPRQRRLQRVQSAWNEFIQTRDVDDEGHVCLDLSKLTLDEACAEWLMTQWASKCDQENRMEERSLLNSVKVDLSCCKLAGGDRAAKSIMEFLCLLGESKSLKNLYYIQADDLENQEQQEESATTFLCSSLIDTLPKIVSLECLTLGGCRIGPHNIDGLIRTLCGRKRCSLISLSLWNCEFADEAYTWKRFVRALTTSKLEELEFYATVDDSMLDMLLRTMVSNKSALQKTLRYLGFRFASLYHTSLPLLTNLVNYLTNLQGFCLEGCSELVCTNNQSTVQINDTSHLHRVEAFAHSLAASQSLFWLHLDSCIVADDLGQIVLWHGLRPSKTLQVLHLSTSKEVAPFNETRDLTNEATFCIENMPQLAGLQVESANLDDLALKQALHKNINLIAFNELPCSLVEDTDSQSPCGRSLSRILFRNQALELVEEFLARDEDAFDMLTLPFCVEQLNNQEGDDPSALFAFISATSNKWHK